MNQARTQFDAHSGPHNSAPSSAPSSAPTVTMVSRFRTAVTMVLATGAALVLAASPFSAHAGGGVQDLLKRAAEHGFNELAARSSAAPVQLPSTKNGFQACRSHFPGQQPAGGRALGAEWKLTELCFDHFAVLYSGHSKSPLLVIERLNRAQIADAADEQRADEFFADTRVAARQRASLEDFRGSGCDRGHMAPAANMPNAKSMAQSFALTNMVCQDPTNNRKIWAKIESDVRKYVRRASGDVFVFSGPLFLYPSAPKTIGAGVWVPTHLFKLVYDVSEGRAWAHVIENTATAQIGRPMDYASFVRATSWNVLPEAPTASVASR